MSLPRCLEQAAPGGGSGAEITEPQVCIPVSSASQAQVTEGAPSQENSAPRMLQVPG